MQLHKSRICWSSTDFYYTVTKKRQDNFMSDEHIFWQLDLPTILLISTLFAIVKCPVEICSEMCI